MLWLLATANVAPISSTPVTLMMEAMHSSDTSVLTTTWSIMQKMAFYKHLIITDTEFDFPLSGTQIMGMRIKGV
jgi:hypothetical protein